MEWGGDGVEMVDMGSVEKAADGRWEILGAVDKEFYQSKRIRSIKHLSKM